MNSVADVKKRACDSCHRRKIQCDFAPSQCNWCKHHGLVCTFNRPFGRGKSSRKTGTADCENVSSQTGTWGEPTDASTPSGVPADAPAGAAGLLPGAVLGGLHFAGSRLGGGSSYNGIPFFSDEGEAWIVARAGFPSAFRAICATGPPWQRQKQMRLSPTALDSDWELPDRPTVEAYFSVFCKSGLRLVFPIVDSSTFMRTVSKAYAVQVDQPAPDAIGARACVLSFMSILVRMEGRLDSFPAVDSDRCAMQARSLMPHIITEASCESLQVCVMQCMYNLFSGNTEAAAFFHSIACRLVMMLGGHLEPPGGEAPPGKEETWATRRYLRRVFWLCYMYDKDICLRAGHPPIMDDDHCDLALPPGYKQIDGFDDFRDGGDLFPGDVRLSIIKSKAIKLLYCAKAFRKSDAELLRDTRELDEELERWRVSIPHPYRPSLAPSYAVRIDPAASKPKKVHIIVIHFEYYSIMAMIHSVSGRCRAWESREADQMAGVTSSQALALQASRSTLVSLRAATPVLSCGDFWIFVFYPISASLTIFCNILMSPLSPHAWSDTELLQSVPSLIKEMRARRLTVDELNHVEMIDKFVVELTRLAECAMARACWGRAESCPLLMRARCDSDAN